MTNLWYWAGIGSQGGSIPTVNGIYTKLMDPGGWDIFWNQGMCGWPPGSILSDYRVPLALQDVTGKLSGSPTQDLTLSLPRHYLLGLFSFMARYKGDILLHRGSPHNSPSDPSACLQRMNECGLQACLEARFNRTPIPSTYSCFDAFGEGGFNLGYNIYGTYVMKRAGFLPAFEGGLPSAISPFLSPFLMQVVEHGALTNMVNDPAARLNTAPLLSNTLVWGNTFTGTPEEQVFQAQQIMAGGVVIKGASPGFSSHLDSFQLSASRPLHVAISCGITIAQVPLFWPKQGATT